MINIRSDSPVCQSLRVAPWASLSEK
jgi:hypothetical protein